MTRPARTLPGRHWLSGNCERRAVPLAACACIFFGLMGARATRSAEIDRPPAGLAGSGRQIAIADFDGDRDPDTATLQAGASDGSRTSYSIWLHMSAAGRQSIQVLGPMGGLDIVARDVNGDHAIDIVLTAAWLKQPVAVLVNDGHGNFSRVEPGEYPGAFPDSNTVARSAPSGPMVAAASTSDWRTDIPLPASERVYGSPNCRFSGRVNVDAESAALLVSTHSRAPPARVSIA